MLTLLIMTAVIKFDVCFQYFIFGFGTSGNLRIKYSILLIRFLFNDYKRFYIYVTF